MRLQVGLVLTLASAATAQAQNQAEPLLEPRFKITESYDKFEDESTVSLLLEDPILNIKNTTLYLMVLQDYKGSRAANQRLDLTFAIANITPEIRLRYGSNHSVNFLADGKRIKVRTRYDTKLDDNDVLSEQIIFRMEDKDFLALVDAKEVQVKVGSDEITFNPEHLNGLKWLRYYRDNPQVPIPKKAAKP